MVEVHVAAPPTAWAAGYTVNDVTDPGDGTCDGTCTLRDAILAANASGGADTITFSTSGTIVLSSALPTNTNTLTIDGSGQSVAVDGAGALRVFKATAPLTFTTLTIQNGKADGITGGNDDGNGGGAYFGSLGACRREKADWAGIGHRHRFQVFISIKNGSNRRVSMVGRLHFRAAGASKPPFSRPSTYADA